MQQSKLSRQTQGSNQWEYRVVKWIKSLNSFDYFSNIWLGCYSICYSTGQNPYVFSTVACWISYIYMQPNSDQLLCQHKI